MEVAGIGQVVEIEICKRQVEDCSRIRQDVALLRALQNDGQSGLFLSLSAPNF